MMPEFFKPRLGRSSRTQTPSDDLMKTTTDEDTATDPDTELNS